MQGMLAAAGRRGGELVAHVSTRRCSITAQQIAVNAVMAGCLPEYYPVVETAVRAIAQPQFGVHGPITSTAGAAILVIVHGPMARRLGVRSGGNLLGPGARANATIGRALRLVILNVLGARGELDRSTFGQPGKYTSCIAEHDSSGPWPPLHAARGLDPGCSAVTVFACEAQHQVNDHLSATPQGILDTVARVMALRGQCEYLLVFGAEHLATLRAAGWSRQDVVDYLWRQARAPLAYLKTLMKVPGSIEPGDGEQLVRVVEEPGDIMVMHAGGEAGRFSLCFYGWATRRNSRAVTLPLEG
ncbi:MAG: hypothetical protein HYY96_01530 [Candidatus Tectomicrobia bacterium]|nr:hypothetical protein [Candidatus Tectomicrobia bacterium]